MLSSTDEQYLRRAIDLAASAGRQGNPPFAAVITDNGKVVASAVNEVIQELDPTQHAEVAVIRVAAKALGSIDLRNCVLYTSCEPCVMCRGALLWASITSVYFSATREIASKYGFTDGYEDIRTAFSKQHFIRGFDSLGEEPFVEWTRCRNRLSY